MKKITFLCFGFLFLISVYSQTTRDTLIIGDISLKPAKKIARFSPVAKYIAGQLNDYGIKKGKVKIVKSTESMIDLFREGKIDLYFDSVYPALKVSSKNDAEILLRRWKEGVAEYNSIIFSSLKSGVKSLEDLPGNKIAFEDKNSSSGFFLPYTFLKSKGFDLVEIKKFKENISKDKISYIFTRSDKNILQWVLDDKLSLGVLDSQEILKLPDATMDKIVVIGESSYVPRQVVVFRKNLDENLKLKIMEIMKNMHKDIRGKRILKKFKNTQKFDDLSESGKNLETELMDMYKLLEE